ncbi:MULTISPECIES: GNAT family N-acetyltransferase [unclassified Sporosarcina]|uniref:GNAT family N-acetyltransferase n=1 Tax=unclassified Sporosarcina TaxID=2647733 RepID=UPI00203E93A7|nr:MULTISPECIES: GNAT family N-acetyltransferase [unclassified Sporosarcina]GKV66948.1 spermidine acetyltransferase [Sporosarcina sp. NCCP-2331]GLB57295.1 spermidine acetyltransferase [Sporosarcina sp. NCCP-2378]
MSLHIREVTAENWEDIAYLSVNDNQKDFIESNSFSLAQSKFEPEWKSVGLYDKEELIGYAMHGRDKTSNNVWLDRFMIDQNYQGKGYASRFLGLLLKEMQQKYSCDIIFLSIYPDNKKAQHLYEKFGFALNGKVDDAGEFPCLVMELDLKRSPLA